jgi:hypothetical protein
MLLIALGYCEYFTPKSLSVTLWGENLFYGKIVVDH